MMRESAMPRWMLLAALAIVLAMCPPVPAEDSWDDVERIVAVGDVHGDFGQFVKVLHAAKVIDEKNDWIAGKTHLVQTGDVLDRGPDSRKAMDLLMKLEEQSAKAGGAVHALIGNHEAMVLQGDWRYLTEGEKESFGGAEAFREAMSARGKYGKWIRSHNAVIRINDIIFCHAGLTARYAGKALAEINKAVREGLDTDGREGVTADAAGPLWDRTLALEDETALDAALDRTLKAHRARHMVIGHTVATEGVLVKAGGRIIRIDVGMCGFYGGPAACLLVEKGVFYEIRDGAENKKLDVSAPKEETAEAVK